MGRATLARAEMERAERNRPVIQLRCAGYSYRRIAALTGISKSTVARVFNKALAEAGGIKDLERHRQQIFADAELLLQNLRKFVLADDAVPSKENVVGFMLMINQKAKLLERYLPSTGSHTVRVAGGMNADVSADAERRESEPPS